MTVAFESCNSTGYEVDMLISLLKWAVHDDLSVQMCLICTSVHVCSDTSASSRDHWSDGRRCLFTGRWCIT